MTTQPTLATEISPDGFEPDAGFGGVSRSRGRIALGRFLHSWSAMAGLIVFVGLIGFSYIYPFFYHWDYSYVDLRPVAKSAHPGTAGHLLGTDGTGYDLLARMMRGAQRDFIIMVLSSAVALTIGITIGSLAGYFGKVADNLLMRFVDVMLAVPVLVILIVVAYQFPGLGPVGLGLLFGAFGWMGLSRLVRAEFLTLREREFVEAAHAMGASNRRIIFRHLIPNVLSTILVFATLFAATSIVVETSLTFLGYGVREPDTSLGLLISEGVDAADTRQWLFYFPGLMIIVIVLSVNLIGEGIRNAFDPRHTRVRD